MPPRPDENDFHIFLSYHENIEKSAAIVEELDLFFKDWGIGCYVFKNHRGHSRDEIHRLIGKSDYFLQIFTNQPRSSWMQKEWDVADTLFKTEQRMKCLFALYTTETENYPAVYNEIERIIDMENFNYIAFRVDNSKIARPKISGILQNAKKLGDEHGNIELPECCQASEPINLSYVGEFIQNFSAANTKGLECVFPDRDAAQKKLIGRMSSLHKDETVSMLGFTLKRFVHPDHEKKVGKSFKKAIDQGTKARLLLLDLTCGAAKERNDIESLGMALDESLLGRDSKMVSNYWQDNNNVEIKYYKTPYVGMILFNDQIFVEIYHLGKQIEDQGICGRVPIMIFRKISKDYQERVTLKGDPDFYEIFSSHFENVWSTS